MTRERLKKVCSGKLFLCVNFLFALNIVLAFLNCIFSGSVSGVISALPQFPLIFTCIGMWRIWCSAKTGRISAAGIRCVRNSLTALLIGIFAAIAACIADILLNSDVYTAVMDGIFLIVAIIAGVLIISVAAAFFISDLRFTLLCAGEVSENESDDVSVSAYSLIVFGILCMLALVMLAVGTLNLAVDGDPFVIVSSIAALTLYILCIAFGIQINIENEKEEVVK